MRDVAIAAAAVVIIGGVFAARRFAPALVAPFGRPPADITGYLPQDSIPAGAVNETGLPLKLPPGFGVSIFAKNLPGARVMRFDQFGNLWVSRTGEGAVTLLEVRDGKVASQDDIFVGLQKPHGLAFDPDRPLLLYIAEEHRVWRVTTYSDDPGEDVLTLPTEGGGHFTRTIGFGPDGKLYISVGSSCNVCRERDERRAAILRYDLAARRSEVFTRGLRNAVFFTWDARGRMWAAEMGRDWLGDDLPPDEVDIVEGGRHYGWPYCYGRQVRDRDFEPAVAFDCAATEPSAIDIPAHSAPLGLAFVLANAGWPQGYAGDLLVSYHGSWNRSQPTGYKVTRHKFNAAGAYKGVEDFITGWLTPEGALGRPVDIIFGPDKAMYLSDDKAGVIYRIAWMGR